MLGNHDSIIVPLNTEYAKEIRKHEAHHTRYGAPGRPFVYREFPKMLYKAERTEAGREMNHTTVGDEDEQRNMQSRGFCLTQQEALDALDREQTEHGRLAAEREYEIAKGKLSALASKEVRAAEAEHGARHLPEVKETPIKRRGRPFKVQPTTEG